MADLTQIHLAGPGCSGRGVRLRRLSPSEVDEATTNAARTAGTDNTAFIFGRLRECVCRMVAEVTIQKDLPDQDGVQAASWKPVGLSELELDSSPYAYDKVFTAKDDSVLSHLFRQWHEAGPAEVAAILGKALMVSGG